MFHLNEVSIFLLLICSLLASSRARSNHSNLWNSAFCRDTSYYANQHFPTDLSEAHLPWIWDAVYDPTKEIIDIVTMSRDPCDFDKKVWRELLDFFPRYKRQLAFGLESNILVPYPENMTEDQRHHLLGNYVICEFLIDNQRKSSLTTRSLRIRGNHEFSNLGGLVIRCPVPRSKNWDRVLLRLNPDREVYLDKIFSNESIPVSACKLPEYSAASKQYDLVVCTATARSHRDELVEWIEYHRMQGVQHFYIYNTALSDVDQLSKVLSDYIADGVVSVIPWHFMNCVRGMASGRWAIWFQNNTKHAFKSPRALAQSAALASCYSRFKHSSRYMLHIDDDEFLAYSADKMSSALGSELADQNLVNLADAIFRYHPKAAAIRFEPVMFMPCAILPMSISYNSSNALLPEYHSSSAGFPRLNRWKISEPGDAFEAKLLMRTDAVGMFFVHFISMLEPGPWRKDEDKATASYPLTHLAMLHYKYPPSLTDNILEEQLPLTPSSFPGLCRWTRSLEYLNKQYHAMQSTSFFDNLEQKYRDRRLQTIS
jgi:hypothetical protein